MRIEALEPGSPEPAAPLADVWEYGPREFARLVALSEGCSVVAHDGDEAVGLTLGFPYGPVGWIGAVLVLESQRGRGLGQRLVEASLECLRDRGVETVKLYATPKAISLYERIGFKGEAEFTLASGGHRRGRAPDVAPLDKHLDAALALDSEVFPGDRETLLRRLVADHPDTSIAVLDEAGELAGFGIARPAALTEIGPVVVRDGNANLAQALVDGLLVRVPEGPVELIHPRTGWAAKSAWGCRGFIALEHPLEMRLGPPVQEARSAIVAAGGQELG